MRLSAALRSRFYCLEFFSEQSHRCSWRMCFPSFLITYPSLSDFYKEVPCVAWKMEFAMVFRPLGNSFCWLFHPTKMLQCPSVKIFALEEWAQYVSQHVLCGSHHKFWVMLGFPWFDFAAELTGLGYFGRISWLKTLKPSHSWVLVALMQRGPPAAGALNRWITPDGCFCSSDHSRVFSCFDQNLLIALDCS